MLSLSELTAACLCWWIVLAGLGLVFNSVIEMAIRARLKCQWFVTQEVAYNGISLCELDTVFHFLCLVLELLGNYLL